MMYFQIFMFFVTSYATVLILLKLRYLWLIRRIKFKDVRDLVFSLCTIGFGLLIMGAIQYNATGIF